VLHGEPVRRKLYFCLKGFWVCPQSVVGAPSGQNYELSFIDLYFAKRFSVDVEAFNAARRHVDMTRFRLQWSVCGDVVVSRTVLDGPE
jgi:hypothetical protein